MEIAIKSTDEMVMFDGVPTRRWTGFTAAGVECDVFVHRIAVRSDRDNDQFVRDLEEQPQPQSIVPFPLNGL